MRETIERRKQKGFNATIVEDIRLVNQVTAATNNKLKKAIEVPQKTLDYYANFITWCENLKNDILFQSGFADGEVSSEEIMNATISMEQKDTITSLRASNPFYKRVLAEYAKNTIVKLLDVLDDGLKDLSESEKDLYLCFDTTDIEISGKKIKAVEDRVKDIVKEKIQSSQGQVRVPLADRDRYKNINDYVDVYIRVLSDSNSKLRVKRLPEDIYKNIQQLSEKVQLLRNRGILTEQENTYYHGVLYRLGEYYVSVAEGKQIPIEEGLRGIKIDKDQFIINQLIAEAVREAYTYPEETNKREMPKIYFK
ncbi:MAG: hypothetical protein IJI60_03215 [Bacilli bacterium]|nr:hypothetical protein [Bacilli bacterium]